MNVWPGNHGLEVQPEVGFLALKHSWATPRGGCAGSVAEGWTPASTNPTLIPTSENKAFPAEPALRAAYSRVASPIPGPRIMHYSSGHAGGPPVLTTSQSYRRRTRSLANDFRLRLSATKVAKPSRTCVRLKRENGASSQGRLRRVLSKVQFSVVL